MSGFLAAWTIAYGGIQAVAPALVSRSLDGLSRELPSARLWALVLAAVPITLAAILNFTDVAHPEIVLLIGLSFFGLPFAVNSSLHSYLMRDPKRRPKTSASIMLPMPPDVCSVSPCQVFSISSAE